MEAKNATTQDFPATLAFDPENAVLAGAGNGWFAAIACDSTLHRGGVGAEIARRWNAHEALLAALERIESQTHCEYSRDEARAALRLARGAS